MTLLPRKGGAVSKDIVVVHTDRAVLAQMTGVLSQGGYQVRAASSFEEAKRILAEERPALLITAIRLGAYNGLHLVVRTRAGHPRLGTVVTGTSAEAGLEADARQCGAVYLTEPVEPAALLAKAAAALEAVSAGWPEA